VSWAHAQSRFCYHTEGPPQDRTPLRFFGCTPFDGSIWITFCSGRQQISKTSCSISGPTLTTIGRMTLWKDERRIRPCPDQSQISARSVGNPTVAPCTRRRWPPDLSESRPGCDIRSTSAELPRNRSLFSYCNALPRWDRFPATDAFRKWNSSHSRNAMIGKNGPS
jgi:hypothetical protein